MNDNRHWWRGIGASAALSALGYLAFSVWAGWHEVLSAVAKAGLSGTAVMLALSAANYLLRFARWQIYLGCQRHRVSWGTSLNIYVAGFALTTTPGKAGEAIRSIFLSPLGVGYRASLGAFVSERLSDLIAVLLLACLGLGYYPAAWPLLAVGGGATFALLLLISQARWLATIRRQSRIRPGRASRLLGSIARLLLAARRCHRPPVLLLASALSVAAWSAEAYAFHLLLGWLGMHVDLGFAAFVYATAMLAGALSFMPGGLGGAEGAMVALLMAAGQAQGPAVAATLLIRLTTLWFAVLLGVVALAACLFRRDLDGVGQHTAAGAL